LVVPGHFVNVTDEMEMKEEMLRCHKSQKNWLDVSQGLDSYLHTMRDICAELGRMSQQGWDYAEGFRRHSHLGFSRADADPVKDVLGDLVAINEDYEKSLSPPVSA
ncbi:unnamed protein product, partial [marine sediment metagenome]